MQSRCAESSELNSTPDQNWSRASHISRSLKSEGASWSSNQTFLQRGGQGFRGYQCIDSFFHEARGLTPKAHRYKSLRLPRPKMSSSSLRQADRVAFLTTFSSQQVSAIMSVKVLSFCLMLSATTLHAAGQSTPISVGPYLSCDLTTFQCSEDVGCCTIGGCCGSGCCPSGYTCINAASGPACCSVYDPTLCGTRTAVSAYPRERCVLF